MPIGIWMVGRVAEGVGLENQKRRKSFVGSNPTPSLNLARRRNKVGGMNACEVFLPIIIGGARARKLGVITLHG